MTAAVPASRPVLVPRPAGRGDELRGMLEAAGFSVEHRPFLDFTFATAEELEEDLTRLAGGLFTHVVLTSRTAVEALSASGRPLPVPVGTRVVAVGPGTAAALSAHGIRADLVAASSGEALVAQMPEATGTEQVWFPSSAAAAPTVREGLTAKGYRVHQSVAYRPQVLPQPAEVTAGLREGRYGAIVLTSPMIARAAAGIGVHPAVSVVSIGAPTSAAANAAGLRVDRRAEEATDAGLAAAVMAVLDDPSPSPTPSHPTSPSPSTSTSTEGVLMTTGSPGSAAGLPLPIDRPRRLRSSAALRSLVREHTLRPADLVLPMFVREGASEPRPIGSMPGVEQHSMDSLVRAATQAVERGVGGLMLFGVPERKDAIGSGATDPDGILNRALARLRSELGDSTVIMADLCLDEFTDHGHCGVLDATGRVDNDATLVRYRDMALAQAEAGAHLLGPSGMMDGQIAVIRDALDAAGHTEVVVYAYTAKYASAFYGPFREAVDSSLQGDRRTYQQDPANGREALRELELDIAEGADLVMVKPGLPYLDVLREVAQHSPVPVGAYQVSGEYAMIEAAAANGWIDRDRTVLESLLAFRRAGASTVLTYYASEVAGWYVDGLPPHLREFL